VRNQDVRVLAESFSVGFSLREKPVGFSFVASSNPDFAVLCNELAEGRSQLFEARMPQVKLNSSPMKKPAAQLAAGFFTFGHRLRQTRFHR
jgi:hypothetical protein